MSKPSRPNILHIFTDQQRFDSLAAHGNPVIRTPNLDRLVREGASFQRAYSPSPECVPARACMITGHYPGRTRCYSNGQPMPDDSEPSYMDRLSQAGYTTHGVGKCHFTPDPYALRGFQSRDTQEELPRERLRDDYARHLVDAGYEHVLEPHGVRGEMYYVPQVSLLPESEHPTHWVADRSLDFIQSQQGGKQPWYLYTGIIHPHPPFAPPGPWHKAYRGPEMPLPEIPDKLDELLCHINRKQNRYKYRDRGLDLNLIRQMRAYYFACIEFIDTQVGRLLDALEASGQLENTLILFSADHGEYLGDYGCFGKRGMHDASARIPLIVRWPDGSFAGERPETPASLVDLAPTFLEAAGIDYAKDDFDGTSLRGIVSGQSTRSCVYSHYNCGENGLYMVVESAWKYIFSAPDQKEYLFDLRNDPREHQNLASSPEHDATLSRLRTQCQGWLATYPHADAALDDSGQWREHPIQHMPEHPDEGLIFQDQFWWQGTENAPRRTGLYSPQS